MFVLPYPAHYVRNDYVCAFMCCLCKSFHEISLEYKVQIKYPQQNYDQCTYLHYSHSEKIVYKILHLITF